MKTIKISDNNAKRVQNILKEKRDSIMGHLDVIRVVASTQTSSYSTDQWNDEVDMFEEALSEIDHNIALFD